MLKLIVLVGLVVAIVVVLILLLRNNAAPSGVSASRKQEVASTSSPAPENTGQKLNWLEGIEGPVTDKTYHIGQRAVTIGRAPTNFVQIMEKGVSRFHVRLTPVGMGLDLQDMNSSSGTKVNGNGLSKASLKDGDKFTVGSSTFVFRRTADFAVNEGLIGRKAIGGEAIKPTLMEEDGGMVESLVLRALDEYSNDVVKVAQVTNMSLDMVEKIRDKYKK